MLALGMMLGKEEKAIWLMRFGNFSAPSAPFAALQSMSASELL